MFLSVMVPAYNEEENVVRGVLAEVNNYLKKQKYSWEVIVVDDGSTDRTATLVTQFVKQHKGFSLLRIPHSGKAGAILAGFQKAKGEILLFTDFDQSVPIGEIEKVLPLFEGVFEKSDFQRHSGKRGTSASRISKRVKRCWIFDQHDGKDGYDVVIGSRVSRQGAPLVRKITGYGFIFLQKLLLGLPYKDTQCGFKAFTREAAQKIMKNMVIFAKGKNQTGYAPTAGFDLEILVIARKTGLKVAEIPVSWRYRYKNTFNTLKVSFLALYDMINIRRIL